MSSPFRALLPLSLLALGCASAAETGEAPPPETTPTAGATKAAAALTGVFVPAEFEAVSLWPEAYRGELLVLEVMAQGSSVATGDVVARLDQRALEDQIRQAQLDVRSAEVKHAGLQGKDELARQAAQSQRARASAALERARRAFEGYTLHELAFSLRGDGLAETRERHRLDDQRDELDQLELMYEADELTDATEEIVLKRSRRDLDWTQQRNALSRDQRAYQVEHTRTLQREEREEALQKQEEQLAHLVRSQSLEALAREDAEARSAAELEKKRVHLARLLQDLELLTIRAPRDGILLHGKARDYRPGGSPPRPVRGSKLSARQDVLLVASPARLELALDVPESALAKVRDGAGATVRPIARPDVELRGTLVLPTYPASRKGDESLFEGVIELGESAPGLVIGMHAKVELGSPR